MKTASLLPRKAAKPVRMRPKARPYRIVKRSKSRYLAVRLRGGKQRSSKCEDYDDARSFAYRWIAEVRPDLAAELGVEVAPVLKNLKR